MKALTSSKLSPNDAGPTLPSRKLKEEFTMNTFNNNRRNFMKNAGALALGSTLPLSLVELAFAESDQNFTFAYISDAHIQHIKGTSFVRNWDRGFDSRRCGNQSVNTQTGFCHFRRRFGTTWQQG